MPETIYLRCGECGAEGTMTRRLAFCPQCVREREVPPGAHEGCGCGVSLCMDCLNDMGAGHDWRIAGKSN